MQVSFDEIFLDVLKEVFIYIMKDDQKYVFLLNSDGSFFNQFLFVSNIDSQDFSQVIGGNEWVICFCLVDVEFFFNIDKK